MYQPFHYQHPSDRESLVHLRAVKWFETLSKQILAEDLERDAYFLNVIDNVRMTRKNFPLVHSYVEKASEILELHPTPELFLDTNPQPTILSMGETRPTIVISSGLLELLSDEEME